MRPDLAVDEQCASDLRPEQSSDRRELLDQGVARRRQLAAVVHEEWRREAPALARQPGVVRPFVRRWSDRPQRLAHEQLSRLRGIGRQLLIRPDGEGDRGHHEEREERQGETHAIAACPAATSHSDPAYRDAVRHDAREPQQPDDGEVEQRDERPPLHERKERTQLDLGVRARQSAAGRRDPVAVQLVLFTTPRGSGASRRHARQRSDLQRVRRLDLRRRLDSKQTREGIGRR